MTVKPSIYPARLLEEQLAQATPDDPSAGDSGRPMLARGPAVSIQIPSRTLVLAGGKGELSPGSPLGQDEAAVVDLVEQSREPATRPYPPGAQERSAERMVTGVTRRRP